MKKKRRMKMRVKGSGKVRNNGRKMMVDKKEERIDEVSYVD
jgi:hypothetical protein